ncbi:MULTISPECIES: ABC transporter permease [Butyricimonas]|uniref:ABC transporter permease n=1 Tax=Butyricimonas TaxID=574697 RepID=UPI0007FB2C18|nr:MULTISPECIES: ABC transporter permease [Butyricimonas]
MSQLCLFFKPIWCNIICHKAYALFCVLGTMLTFIFITIIMQISHVLLDKTPPVLNAERIVFIPDYLENDTGKFIKGINKSDVKTLVSNLKEKICYTSSHFEAASILVNGQYNDYGIHFIDENYWNVFQFEFVQGHAFTKSEMEIPCAIVNENFVKTFFPDKDVLNKEIYFQQGTYKITGVVADVSFFSQEGHASLWVPEKFNKQIPTGNDWVKTYILFPENMNQEAIMRSITSAFKLFTKMYNVKGSSTLKQIKTVDEVTVERYGGDLLMMGVCGIIFILLIIPILNIVLLSMANTNIQVNEIGLKRALGADKKTAFLSILMENFLLVVLGTILGIILTLPVCEGIDCLLFSETIDGKMTILASLNWGMIFAIILPLSLFFSLFSGGIPAYWMVKRPIIDMLKGGSKC